MSINDMSSNVSFQVHSMVLQGRLRSYSKSLENSLQRLSSGSSINVAKDNPLKNYEAGNLESEISSKERAKRNSSDGAAFLQIAEGTCNEVQNILHRVRELSIQAANDTLTSSERYYLNEEADTLLKEVDRIVASTTYNTKTIFGDKGDSFSDESRKLVDADKSKAWNPFSQERIIDEAVDEDDFIVKKPVRNEVRAGILHINSGATKVDEVKISIPEISALGLGLDSLSLTYQNGATKAIDDLDAAISALGIVRSYMGVMVNSLDKQVYDLGNFNVNLNEYVGKIKDVDVAKESTAMVSAQIQQQAAISVLSQSNSRVSRVLEMLAR
ncbi:MAG: flagellin [Fibromonadaceae bacterium]|jgi:flagellin|nr:flagellin [Fibromonadaceae bacterium]